MLGCKFGSSGSESVHFINAGFYISIDFDRYIFGSGSPWIVIWIAPLERARRELFKNIFCVGVSFGIGRDMGVSLNPVFSNPALFLPTFWSQNRTPILSRYGTVIRRPTFWSQDMALYDTRDLQTSEFTVGVFGTRIVSLFAMDPNDLIQSTL